jgi:hypothetical protein
MPGFTAQTNSRIARDSDVVLKPIHDQNAYRKSVRELAAKQIQTIRAKQQQHITRELNSFGRVAGGEAGYGEPLRNRGHYGVSPPLTYSFKARPKYSPIIGDRLKFAHLGNTYTSNIPFSNIPARETGIYYPPKKINIR